jgi:hypothetical protein
MARIRTIKPEFFTSEDIVALSPYARLLYIALWCEADKEGRMAWKPRTFKMRYLPADDVAIDGLCKEIIDAGLVRLYGEGYAYIPAFHAHQHINPRESVSQLPEPPDSDAQATRKPRVVDASGTREARDSDAQVGREGKGKEGKEDASLRDDEPPAPEPSASRPKPNTTPVGELCKRIRQEAKLMGVNPTDPKLIALRESGYSDDTIFDACREAADKGKPWGWAFAAIQNRAAEAAKVKAAPPVEDRAAKFVGGI